MKRNALPWTSNYKVDRRVGDSMSVISKATTVGTMLIDLFWVSFMFIFEVYNMWYYLLKCLER
jgi:hypothetical protein